jgi:N-acetylglucosamine repressor
MKTLVESRKQFKRNNILDLIRRSHTPLSRFDLKKLTGYSMTTISGTISDLINSGMLISDPCTDTGRMGRKPIFLHLDPEGGYFIGIEFNIEAVHYVVLDFTCQPLYVGQADIPSEITAPLLLDIIVQRIKECIDYLGSRKDKILGIGLGVPGYIDAEKGIALSNPHLADWTNIPIVQIMEDHFGLPCYIGNNVGVMGLVFKWIDKYREDSDFLLVSVRTGVRCIPVLGHQPYFGRISNTGEIGHLKVSRNHRICDCGQIGCLNTEITDYSIRAKLEEGFAQNRFKAVHSLCGSSRPSVSVLVRAALDGDPESAEEIRQDGIYLGSAVAEAANLFAPQKIILSGQLIKAGSIIMDPLLRRVRECCVPDIVSHMEIIPSPYGDGIGALGAAVLPLEKEYNPMLVTDTR